MDTTRCIQLVNKLEDLRAKLAEFDEIIEKAQDAVANRPREEETRRVLEEARELELIVDHTLTEIEEVIFPERQYVELADGVIDSCNTLNLKSNIRNIAIAVAPIDTEPSLKALSIMVEIGSHVEAARITLALGNREHAARLVAQFSNVEKKKYSAAVVSHTLGDDHIAKNFIRRSFMDHSELDLAVKLCVLIGDIQLATQILEDALNLNSSLIGPICISLAKVAPKEAIKGLEYCVTHGDNMQAAAIAEALNNIGIAKKLLVECNSKNKYSGGLVAKISKHEPAFAKEMMNLYFEKGLYNSVQHIAMALGDKEMLLKILKKDREKNNTVLSPTDRAECYCELDDTEQTLKNFTECDTDEKSFFLVYYFNKLAKEMKEE